MFIAASIQVDRADAVGDALDRAAAAAAAGATLIEWRLDRLAEDPAGAGAARRLIAESPRPCIVTCRAEAEGGAFAGRESDRREWLVELAAASPAAKYIDVELATVLDDDTLADRLRGAQDEAPRLIYSSHDFDGRPADLLQRLEAMASDPRCAVIKLAWTARSVRDTLEAFDLLAERPKPMTALCMGEFGVLSRVLAGKFGGLLTFAAPPGESGTAPGQPDVHELHDRYRFDEIGPDTAVYGVIGWPVAHSLSPHVHNVVFAELNVDAVYVPLPVAPGWEPFKATVASLVDHPRLNFRGASVTMPHKSELARFVRERGGDARNLHSANTLLCNDPIACIDTDTLAACWCLGLTGLGILRGVPTVILGAGGVARAIARTLVTQGADDVTIVNRTPDRAAALAESIGVRAADPASLATGEFRLIINATSVGMQGGPDPEGTPLSMCPAPVPLDASVIVFDTVYTPVRTPLIESAEAAGATIVTGDQMFVAQAALQASHWLGPSSGPLFGLYRQAFNRATKEGGS